MRDNFYSFITDAVDGVRLMSLAELLDYVENKAAFERLLNALDVPALAIRNPVVEGAELHGSLVPAARHRGLCHPVDAGCQPHQVASRPYELVF